MRVSKRLVLFMYDLAAALIMAAILLVVSPMPAYAYVDPSVMTYTIQALAGVAVALSAVAGVAFRRSRRTLMKALGIDENANKETDPAWERLTPSAENLSLMSTNSSSNVRSARPSVKRNRKGSGKTVPGHEQLSWPKRFALALVCVFFASFTLLFVAPCETIVGSNNSMAISIGDAWWLLTIACLILTLVGAILVSFLRGKAYAIILAAICAFGLCCYIQAMFLNIDLPIADGATIDWIWYRKEALLSEIVWISVFVALIVLAVMQPRALHLTVLGMSLALLIVQGVGVGSLLVSSTQRQSGVEVLPNDIIVTEDGLFDASDKNNVIVFVLDTYDTRYLEHLVDGDYPNLLDEFTGFTWYKNCSGSMIPTRYAVPYLLSNTLPAKGQTWDDYNRDRLADSNFIEDIDAAGYSIGLYTDSTGVKGMDPSLAWPKIGNRVINLEAKTAASFNQPGILKGSVIMALYRDLPWSLKPFFRFDTDYINGLTLRRTSTVEDHIAYALDDDAYYKKLKENGLSISEDDNAGAFKFIHMQGAHYPFTLDENAVEVGVNSTDMYKQCVGSMRIVEEYLRQLKELGLYDDATIIITADHGDWYLTDQPLQDPTAPYMLVKQGHQTHEEASAPYTISMAPVSHMDFCASVIKAVGGDYSSYGTPIEDVPDGDRTRYYYMTTSDGQHDVDVLEYAINGYVYDFDTWELTGESWHVRKD